MPEQADPMRPEHGATEVPGVWTASAAWRLLLVAGAAGAAAVGWHTLGQDVGLAAPVAAVLAVAQAASLPFAHTAPRRAWVWSSLVLLVAVVVAERAGDDGWWPDPSLYVHLAVVAIGGLQLRARELAAVVAATLVPATVVGALAGDRSGSPGWAEGAAMVVVVATVAGVVGHAIRGRDRALAALDIERRAAEVDRVRATLLAERGRIARELHDVVAHHMTVVAMQAEAANVGPDSTDELRQVLTAVRTSAVDGLVELRRLVGLLRDDGPEGTAPPPGLDDLGRLAADVRAAGVQVDLELDPMPGRADPGTELSAFRIVQESLNNAMRHAPGAAVQVRVDARDRDLQVTVRNGQPQAAATTMAGAGHGLIGMRERAAMLGGQLEAGPTADGGYLVVATLPRHHLEDT